MISTFEERHSFSAVTSGSGRDRRTDPRLTPEALSIPASVRIPNRSGVSLIDLSPGGALINIPFQVRPDARLMLELRAASERVMMPFRLLRCYVASLEDGVRYQAAGAFEERLDWKPLLGETAAQATTDRLIATLEAFVRHGSPTARVMEFDQLLMWILDAARRGERSDRIAVEIRLRLGRLIPSVTVEATTKPMLPDPARGARFFGLDFKCDRLLTTPDRQLLRAAAQLLSIIDNSYTTARAPRPLDFKPRTAPEPPVIVYGADWKQMYPPDDPHGANARKRTA